MKIYFMVSKNIYNPEMNIDVYSDMKEFQSSIHLCISQNKNIERKGRKW